MKTEELISEIKALPVEERALVVDSVLRSLNPPEEAMDKKWAELAKRRLARHRSGEATAIPGHEVFDEVWKRFNS